MYNTNAYTKYEILNTKYCFMSKKLILALIVLFLSLCCLGYVMFFYTSGNPERPKRSLKKLVFNQPADAYLSMTPNYFVATSSAITSVDVNLQTQSSPTIIQLEIAYDPNSLYSLSVVPGEYFVAPVIPLEKTDYKNGRISYALSGKSINPNSKTIARIYFTPLNYGLRKQTELKFLPKTSIKEGSRLIELKDTSGANITINPSVFIPTATPSASLAPSL